VKHASRHPSLTELASQEHLVFTNGGRITSVVSPSRISIPPRRKTFDSQEHSAGLVFPSTSPLSQRGRFGSMDSGVGVSGSSATESPHRALFRAFCLNSFAARGSDRVDGFPYLSFSTGQVINSSRFLSLFENRVLMVCRNLMLLWRRGRDGWRGFQGVRKLDGYPRVIVLRY